MKSLWSDSDARKFKTPLEKCVHTPRLPGASPELLLHGGGNTAVKAEANVIFGHPAEVIHVQRSG